MNELLTVYFYLKLLLIRIWKMSIIQDKNN